MKHSQISHQIPRIRRLKKRRKKQKPNKTINNS